MSLLICKVHSSHQFLLGLVSTAVQWFHVANATSRMNQIDLFIHFSFYNCYLFAIKSPQNIPKEADTLI